MIYHSSQLKTKDDDSNKVNSQGNPRVKGKPNDKNTNRIKPVHIIQANLQKAKLAQLEVSKRTKAFDAGSNQFIYLI